ncbi:unnamed protein product [Caenorhabditis auriculariae]|uniref:Ras-GAP domain-containing protein n=1 Tax=Caenorhabditis auriculariae TaxID=2777116 RepID=A0A8S1H1I0_9PELO|nr:unnamed protein product [Caenorhabditis auriculariae]
MDELRKISDPFLVVCEKIRSVHIILDAESESVDQLASEIKEKSEILSRKAWNAFQHQVLLNRLISSHVDVTTDVVGKLCADLKTSKSVPSYKILGHRFSDVEQLLSILHRDPISVARILDHVDRLQSVKPEEACNAIFSLVYSCGVYATDENILLKAVYELIHMQLSGTSNPRLVFRKGTSTSCRLYALFTDSLHSTKMYMTSAMHEAVMLVLCQPETFLDIDSSKTIIRFAPAQRAKIFGPDPNDPAYIEKLERQRSGIVKKLILLTNDFVKGICDSMVYFPQRLIWLVQKVHKLLTEGKGLSEKEAEIICTDLIVTNLICPAIIDPEKFGIISDIPISHITRFNLMQIAQIVQALALSDYETPSADLKFFVFQFEHHPMRKFVKNLLQIKLPLSLIDEENLDAFIDHQTSESSSCCKDFFVGTLYEINILAKIFDVERTKKQWKMPKSLEKAINRLPANFSPTAHSTTSPQTQSRDTAEKSGRLRNITQKMNFPFGSSKKNC